MGIIYNKLPGAIYTKEEAEAVRHTLCVNHDYGGAAYFGDGFGIGTESGGGNALLIYTSPEDMKGKRVKSLEQFIKFYNKHASSGVYTSEEAERRGLI